MKISSDDGILLVKAARRAVSEFLKSGRTVPDGDLDTRFAEKSGVFVTLNDGSGLRGCIGYPHADRKLSFALRDAAVAAATRDPRFQPLEPQELGNVTFEVTVLTQSEIILVDNPEEYMQQIKVGRDGLVVRNESYSGLLLPQVPSEYGWNEREFLEHTCRKAGLPRDCWKDADTVVEKFQGIVFKEKVPNGSVIEEL